MKQVASLQTNGSRWYKISREWQGKGLMVARVVTAQQAIAAGIQLLLLKKQLPHGEFLGRLSFMGISKSTAYRYAGVARHFHDSPDVFLDAVGGSSKLFELIPVAELLDFSEKAVTAAHPDGQAVELPFAKLALMTTMDVRKAVRELRQPLAGSKQAGAALMPSEALSEEELVLLQRYRQCPQVAQGCLQLIATLLVTKTS